MKSRSSTNILPTGREVLVVEDEVRLRNMLSQALKQMGFQATLASSAEAGMRELEQKPYDILMLDLNLPGMSGIDFLERLRKKGLDLQVIILTGFGDLESARKSIHLDVVEFLTKPCALGELEVALDRARKRRRGQIVGESGAAATPLFQFDPPPEPTPGAAAPTTDIAAPLSLEELEQQHILSVLEKHKGNRAATATELGISLRKLYYRLGEYERKGLRPS